MGELIMKKNKGFTLVELLAVIVILGILLSISVVSVNKIRNNQEEQNKRNVISSILTGAKNYATDTNSSGDNFVSVKTLHDKDYVDFDTKKYDDLYKDNLYVNISNCSGNNLKRVFFIEVNLGKGIKKYSDCGCESQEGDITSNELCIQN